MGTQQARCTVAILNYSGIYLSPFEFYGIDNWQQLEQIGQIFQHELRVRHKQIRLMSEEEKQPQTESYQRHIFDWDIGSIDKDIHCERYTPLYTAAPSIEKNMFAGIGKRQTNQGGEIEYMMDEAQFCKKWDQVFAQIQNKNSSGNDQVINTARSSKRYQKEQCRMLDFLCYRAIILYLYTCLNRQDDQKVKSFRDSFVHNFDKIIQSTRAEGQAARKKIYIIDQYKRFMQEYFKRINMQTKIDITLKYFFNKAKPGIVCFSEATPELRDILAKNTEYRVYGPPDINKIDQTLLLIKIAGPFQSILQTQHQQQQVIQRMRIDKLRLFKNISEKQMVTIRKDIQAFIYQYMKGVVKIDLVQQLTQLQRQPKETIQRVSLSINKFIDNKTIMQIEVQLKEYVPLLQKYFIQTKQKEYIGKDIQFKETISFLRRLKQEGLLFWMSGSILVKLIGKNSPAIIGSFHLSSKQGVNFMQVQILGLIIHHLFQRKKYHFIFAGDFNSHVTFIDRETDLSMFEFVRYRKISKQQQMVRLVASLNLYPRHPNMITAKKKRTILQPQMRKANELIQKCIDQIITSYPIIYQRCHVCEIKEIGTDMINNQSFLPHLKHPFDHFLVQGIVDLTAQIQ